MHSGALCGGRYTLRPATRVHLLAQCAGHLRRTHRVVSQLQSLGIHLRRLRRIRDIPSHMEEEQLMAELVVVGLIAAVLVFVGGMLLGVSIVTKAFETAELDGTLRCGEPEFETKVHMLRKYNALWDEESRRFVAMRKNKKNARR